MHPVLVALVVWWVASVPSGLTVARFVGVGTMPRVPLPRGRDLALPRPREAAHATAVVSAH